MAKKTVQDIILQSIDRLEVKVDELSEKKIPSLLVEMAIMATKVKEEAKADARLESKTVRIWGGIGGAVTILISVISLAVAYFKH